MATEVQDGDRNYEIREFLPKRPIDGAANQCNNRGASVLH